MPGKRQPTEVVEANGRRHLDRGGEDTRRDREVHVPPPDEAAPPRWLPKRLHREYREIGEILRSAGLYAELDRDVLGQYFLSPGSLAAGGQAGRGSHPGPGMRNLAREWTGVQGTYFKQARQCAEAMGLSVTSRCRIVVPAALQNAAKVSAGDGTMSLPGGCSKRPGSGTGRDVVMTEIMDREAGQFVCDFVSRLPTTDTGKPFQLYDWQRSAIMDFYGTMERDEETREALRKYWYLYLEIPKKNGKSELAAALGSTSVRDGVDAEV